MKKKIEFNFKNIIILILVICILSSVSSYLSTTYALSENDYPIHSRNVEYTDSFNLGANDVQAAINGTCTNVDTRLTSIEGNITKSKEYIIPFNASKTISLSDVSNAGSVLLFIRIGTTLNGYMITDRTVLTSNFTSIGNTYITVSLSNGVITVKNTNTTSNAVAILVGLNA